MEKVLKLNISGQLEEVLLSQDNLGDVVLDTPLTDLRPASDDSDITELNTMLEAIAKLIRKINNKEKFLKLEYLTGTTVLSDAQNGAIIDAQGDCSIFLPQGVDNDKYRIRNVGNGKATFIPFGTDTIENSSSYELQKSNAFDLVFLNGNWYIF